MDHALMFGHQPDGNLVAIDRVDDQGGRSMALFFRKGAATIRIDEAFTPFFIAEEPSLFTRCPVEPALHVLSGNEALKTLACFASWSEWNRVKSWLVKKTGRQVGAPDAPFFAIHDPVQQHLLFSGRTLFKDMTFEQVRRLQLDIETHNDPAFEFCNPDRESDRILVISMSDNTGWEEVLTGDERSLIEGLVRTIRTRDPDVIEGHNLFKFDWAYIAARARRHGVPLTLGRDGSEMQSHASRITIGERTLAYPKYEIFGRHIVDTLFLVQFYDIAHRSLEGFGLKEAARHFHLAGKNRVYIDGDDIARQYERDPARVIRYALDDVRETRALSRLLSRSYFIQAQMLPFSYQNVCVRGSAAKIDALMLREYLRRRHSLPVPDKPREFAGGYTDIFIKGVIRNVHHCDVRSLYPSLMLSRRLCPRKDDLGVFLQLLDYLRQCRIEAKEALRSARTQAEKDHGESLQATFKILINSFYGYLGFAQGRFNDYQMAETVTAEGRALLVGMISWLRAHGAEPVEIDTDGIYFIPPQVKSSDELARFRRSFQASLPDGIEMEFDGDYVSMFSYKMKNYALLDQDGEMAIKGAALKSRGLEPYLRSFLKEYLRLKLEFNELRIPDLHARYETAIREGKIDIRELAKTETLNDAPSTYAAKIGKGSRGRNAAYELALKSERNYQAGDQISYYITGTKKTVAAHACARLVSEWSPQNRDENTAYYLAKLDALYKKFESGEEAEEEENARDAE